MNPLSSIATAAAERGSLHELSEGVSAWTAFGAIIGVLVIAIGTLVMLVRRADLRVIEEARESLDRLVGVVESFRKELVELRVELAAHYVTKAEMSYLERKVEKLREHCTVRGGERRLVEDSEDGV